MRFDPERCRKELQEKFELAEVPGLRIAWPLEDADRTVDSLLQEFDWAETIVCAQVARPDVLRHLDEEIAHFPESFLLFLDADIDLVLERSDGTARELTLSRENGGCILSDGETTSRWRVLTRQVRITDDSAKEDATHIHQRDEVPLSWATSLDGKDQRGRFWAFFPTNTATTSLEFSMHRGSSTAIEPRSFPVHGTRL